MEVNKKEILDLATRLSNCSSGLNNEIKQLRNISYNIGTSWTGNDASKYVDIIQTKYILGLEDLQEKVEEYANYLKNIPGAYELLDEIYASKGTE